jgi:predicted dehydrogenase
MKGTLVDRLGVALLGLDHWYWAFDLAQEAVQGANTRLVSIADTDLARAADLTKRVGVEVSSDFRAALDRPDVQIVIVTTTTDRAPDLIRQAAMLGKHVLCVKPVARSLDEASTVVQAVRGAGVQAFPLESAWRLSPARARVKQWVDEGRIGTPVRFLQCLNSSLPQPWPGSNETHSWWLEPERVPGGGWLDHAIYAIDYARWLFGAEPRAVRGFAANLRYPELRVEDYGVATYDFPTSVAQIEDTWTADRGAGFGRSEIVGTAGAICDDTGTWGRLAVRGDFGHGGWMALEAARGGLPALGHLVDVIRGEAQPLATIDDAYQNLAACLAFYQAAREGATVAIGG